ncbi:nucleotidyltransferase family protein [Microbacterium sp. SORGH_AS_0888]|uniref:nucleotidyltransferase family protein n=1 Tax=Microbacterium sp. SORGH_AS_0888 TaxID=3041791 RepID=UPI00278067BC|nr:nucleotidyltransferase family protein [Microbacterium sp. SORGH_AS_0888]MDQ1129857.1 CTP:molybdopterin cytidylyltransferase MocA [Microbacterium sp. SORGH_AS_0888]
MSVSPPPGTAGLVLAAGAGTRFGGPKGLARTPDGTPWLVRAVAALREAGCAPVLVAIGAAQAEVAALVPPGAVTVPVSDWREGLSASVRAGLAAAAETDAAALVVTTVDTPDLPAAAVGRLRGLATSDALARATYGGRPGHPVLIGRAHWSALADGVAGDRGAGPYLAAHGAEAVECGDLWHGDDVDLAARAR